MSLDGIWVLFYRQWPSRELQSLTCPSHKNELVLGHPLLRQLNREGPIEGFLATISVTYPLSNMARKSSKVCSWENHRTKWRIFNCHVWLPGVNVAFWIPTLVALGDALWLPLEAAGGPSREEKWCCCGHGGCLMWQWGMKIILTILNILNHPRFSIMYSECCTHADSTDPTSESKTFGKLLAASKEITRNDGTSWRHHQTLLHQWEVNGRKKRYFI